MVSEGAGKISAKLYCEVLIVRAIFKIHNMYQQSLFIYFSGPVLVQLFIHCTIHIPPEHLH